MNDPSCSLAREPLPPPHLWRNMVSQELGAPIEVAGVLRSGYGEVTWPLCYMRFRDVLI